MSDEEVPGADLEQYFWNSVDLLSVFKQGGRLGLTNPAWETVLGWDQGSLKNYLFIDLLHPDDVERTNEESEVVWNGDDDTRVGFQNRLRRRDGSYRWIEWTSRRHGDLIYSTGRDVTVRNEYLARLDASVQTTSAIFSAVADLIVIVDRSLKIADFSPSGQSFFGYPDERTSGADVFAIVHPDDRSKVAVALTRVFDPGQREIVTVEYRGHHADGHWMAIEARGQALHSSDGVPTHAVFISRDVTDSLAERAQLAESRETTTAILDAAIDSIIVIDSNLIIVEASHAGERMHGVPSSERRGRDVTELVHPDDREFVASEYRAAFATGGAVSFRCRMIHVDGHVFTIEIRGRTLHGDSGSSSRLVFIARDISDAVAFETALERSLNKMKAILDAAPDSIIVINRALVILEASPGTEMIYGYPKSERMGRSALTIVHPDDKEFVTNELDHLFARDSDDLITYHFRARHADGHWLIIETRGRLLRDHESDEPRAVLVSRDISKSVEAEEALEIAKDEAERANAAKSEFMSRMSHELRTPLNSVLGFAQILQMELESSDDLELVDHVYKSGQHLLTLINEVLDISRVESGNISLTLESVNLHDLVIECLDIIGPQANERDVGIGYGDTFDFQVRADHLRLKQVILNLLSNAIKYNRSHGSVTLHCSVRAGYVRFAVSDTGHGIDPELRERLFTAFDRLDAESRGIEGTGLGLTLSKTLVEAMGGTLGFESVVDDGSTFWFELPLSSAPLGPVASMAPKG